MNSPFHLYYCVFAFFVCHISLPFCFAFLRSTCSRFTSAPQIIPFGIFIFTLSLEKFFPHRNVWFCNSIFRLMFGRSFVEITSLVSPQPYFEITILCSTLHILVWSWANINKSVTNKQPAKLRWKIVIKRFHIIRRFHFIFLFPSVLHISSRQCTNGGAA